MHGAGQGPAHPHDVAVGLAMTCKFIPFLRCLNRGFSRFASCPSANPGRCHSDAVEKDILRNGGAG